MNPKHLIVCITTASLLATAANAAVLRYNGSGNWNKASNGVGDPSGWGLNPNNPAASPGQIPTNIDETRINFGGNTVTVNTNNAVTGYLRVGLGTNERGNLIIANGGLLTVTKSGALNGAAEIGSDNTGATFISTLTVQNGGSMDVAGILWTSRTGALGNMTVNSGGLITGNDHFWWGARVASTITIAGTISQTAGILGLGTENASTASGGTATVNITDGGALNLFNISSSPGQPSIQAGSSINLAFGGTMTVRGDLRGTVQNYIDANKITATGGTFDLSFDSGAGPNGTTTLTVIPEPSVSTLFGALCTLGLFTRRRR